jgi:DNA-binding MarR family transcriptional regulator
MTNVPFVSRFPSAVSSPGFLLWKAANRHQRLQRQALADLGISPTQFSLLACYFFLAETNKRAVSQAEVCEYAALDKMLVSDGTRALLEKQLIVRTRSPNDGRAFAVGLTAVGAETCNRALAVVEALDAAFFAETGDVATFIALTTRLLQGSQPATADAGAHDP